MQTTKEYYNEFYVKSDWDTNRWHLKLKLKVFKKIINLEANKPIHKILDAGCGTGSYTKIFNDLGYNCEGFDFSETAIKKAKEKFPEYRFTCLDAKNLNYDKKFDLIFASGFSLFNTYDFEEVWKLIDYWKSFLTKNGSSFFAISTSLAFMVSPVSLVTPSLASRNGPSLTVTAVLCRSSMAP